MKFRIGMVALWSVAVAIGVLRFFQPPLTLSVASAYQAAAHLFVGVVLGMLVVRWHLKAETPEDTFANLSLLLIFAGLCAVELIAVALAFV